MPLVFSGILLIWGKMDEKLLTRKVEEIAREVCLQQGIGLYDCEVKRTNRGLVVLIFITRLDGVRVEDCQRVSYELSLLLDEKDFINEHYILEVSSPGLERNLKFKMHYVSAIGEKVKVTFHEQDMKNTVVGTLKEVLPDHIILEIKEEPVSINFNSIKKARTYFDYKRET